MIVRCRRTVHFLIWCGAPASFEGGPSLRVTSAFLVFTGSLGLSPLGQFHWPLWSASQLCFSPMALRQRVHRWPPSWLECRSVVLWPQPFPQWGWAMVSSYDHRNVTVPFFLEASDSGVYLHPFYFLCFWVPADGTIIPAPLMWKGSDLLNKKAKWLEIWFYLFYFSGPPTSLASASGSFPNSGLYGSYPQGQAPPLSQAQGHLGAQPPQRSAPPQASSFTSPASGGPRMPSMTGPLLSGQGFGGPSLSQPNHVSSPPPQALPPGTQMTGPPGPPPPMHSSQQPGYQLQQNGEFSARSV